MTQDVTPRAHQRWVEWEQRRGKGSSLGARSGDGPTHKVKRPIFRGYVGFRETNLMFKTSSKQKAIDLFPLPTAKFPTAKTAEHFKVIFNVQPYSYFFCTLRGTRVKIIHQTLS